MDGVVIHPKIYAKDVVPGMTILDAARQPQLVSTVDVTSEGMLRIALTSGELLEVLVERAHRCPVFRVLP